MPRYLAMIVCRHRHRRRLKGLTIVFFTCMYMQCDYD